MGGESGRTIAGQKSYATRQMAQKGGAAPPFRYRPGPFRVETAQLPLGTAFAGFLRQDRKTFRYGAVRPDEQRRVSKVSLGHET
jgi:hypothetical protein